MYDGSQGNAMTEIALALAMGFFSLMVLALVSMGAGRAQEASAVAAILQPAANRTTDRGMIEVESQDTILIYFNPEWKHETGALRLLRSPTDIEDYAAEVPPLSGTLLGFRRSGNSFHGHKRFEGERWMLQMSWVQPTRSAALALRVKRLTTRLMKALRLDRPSNVETG